MLKRTMPRIKVVEGAMNPEDIAEPEPTAVRRDKNQDGPGEPV